MVDNDSVKKYSHHLPFDSWFVVPSVRKSGGLALGYFEKSNLEVISSSFNMIHVMCDITPRIKNCLISFVYGSLNIYGRRTQWNILSSINEDANIPWMLLGDFNFILHESEKQGGIAENSLSSDFIRAKMMDLNMNEIFSFGNPFTWCNRRFKNPAELILEKLDRGFINDKWVSVLPQTRVTNLGRVYSDHTPILLNCFHLEKKLNILYKFFKCWQLNPDFKDVLSNSWSKQLKGSPSFIVAGKLRNVKNDLCLWNVFLSSNPANFVDIQDVLNDVQPIISDDLNLSLVEIPTLDEIFSTIKIMEPWKSPGPDGFSARFFRDNWNIVSDQVVEHVQNFFKTEFLLKNLNYSFIALIPNVQNPSSPNDFRPISLANTVYKIISKILTNRLKPLLDTIISPFQSAFVSNRQIQDNIIISHEILHSFKKMNKRVKKGYMAIKLDLSKAFDILEW
ncbi:uncharacterized protein LOC113295538 [Papaver somniferum]|uniref:uncharacterized protein LOC113295538 n=1 Tax=Papaver somniferum TaxID=3469 RepID=UPI000E704E9E|nr:uncharacterized protein LOC113295538 [Papaver somniferum]